MSDEWLQIGKIVAPQGLQGKVKVHPNRNLGNVLEQPRSLWLERPDSLQPEEVKLLSGRLLPGKNIYLVTIAGVENRNQAEDLRGSKLLVKESDITLDSEDEYYISDLIDLEVYHQLTGEYLGVVTSVFAAGNDLLEVKLDNQRQVLVPFVKEIVTVVDLRHKRLEIQPPAGLLELN